MITDELRHEVANYPFRDNRDFALFEAIADRIDEKHKHAIGYVDDRDPEMMAEHGWVRLPVDTYGEVIHVGDMMEYGKARGHVIALMLSNYPKKWGGGLHWAIQLEGEQAPTAFNPMFHHYHKPTVEDVLLDFAYCCEDGATDKSLDEIVAEYAERLQLREA